MEGLRNIRVFLSPQQIGINYAYSKRNTREIPKVF